MSVSLDSNTLLCSSNWDFMALRRLLLYLYIPWGAGDVRNGGLASVHLEQYYNNIISHSRLRCHCINLEIVKYWLYDNH